MKEDKIIGLILVGFSVFMYSQTLAYPPAMFGTFGAGFFPKILFTLLAVAGAVLTIGGFIRDRKRDRESAQKGKLPEIGFGDQFKTSLHDHSQVILSFFLVFGYFVAMDYLGYMIATLIFMVTFLWFLGPQRRKEIPLIIMISCGMTFSVYLVFLKLLQIFLPEGVLF